MGTLLGGLAIMSARRPVAMAATPVEWILRYVELRSLFFGSIFLAVLVILAYLTNPSEASFRAFLTELSFRRHLSKLNDPTEPESEQQAIQYSLPQHDTKDKLKKAFSSEKNTLSLRYHFANRGAVSLRTPAHIFRSFGILTIAAITPVIEPPACTPASLKLPSGKGVANGAGSQGSGPDEAKVTGSWFIGAFGKWWVAGTVELYKRDALLLSKESPDAKVGLLSFRQLDLIDGGLDALVKSQSNSVASRGKPMVTSDKASRTAKHPDVPLRSATPPPLPLSASLPLHVTRTPGKAHDNRTVAQVTPNAPKSSSDHLHRSPPTSLEQSPLIAEILHQVSISQGTTADLRAQLSSFQAVSSQSHASLQSSLDVHKERRKQEDASRLELKTRTKTLEDSKRHADSTKREAEKKLKVAQAARDKASNRMDRLRKDIQSLHSKVLDDQTRVKRSASETLTAQSDLSRDLEAKRAEIKIAEDVVAALGQRARELEEKIAAEREKLEQAREAAISRRKEYQEQLLRNRVSNSSLRSRFFAADEVGDYPPNHPPFSPFDQPISGPTHRHQSSDPPSTSPSSNRPRSLSLNGISTHNTTAMAYTAPLNRSNGSTFAPFADLDLAPGTSSSGPDPGPSGPLSPVSATLISNSLFRTMEADPIKETESYFPPSAVDVPPTPTFGAEDEEWSGESRVPPRPIGRPMYSVTSPTRASDSSSSLPLMSPTSYEQQRSTLGPAIPEDEPLNVTPPSQPQPALPAARRWFSAGAVVPSQKDKSNSSIKEKSTSLKEKTGLNPDAKVFSFTKPKFLALSSSTAASNHTHHNSLPTIIPSPPSSSSTTNLSLTNSSPFYRPSTKADGIANNAFTGMGSFFSSLSFSPFAPSPAEREALSRALGGSGNNRSLDRLSNLSDTSPNTSTTALHLMHHNTRLPTSPLLRPTGAAPNTATSANSTSAGGAASSSAVPIPITLPPLSRPPTNEVTNAAIQWAAESSLASSVSLGNGSGNGSIGSKGSANGGNGIITGTVLSTSPTAKRSFFSSRHSRSATTPAAGPAAALVGGATTNGDGAMYSTSAFGQGQQ